MGQTKLPLASSRDGATQNTTRPMASSSSPSMATMLVLGDQQGTTTELVSRRTRKGPIQSLLIPLTTTSSNQQLRLLSFAYGRRPVPSLTVLLMLNSLFVNRDGGLFDNIPWTEWSRDPQRRNRDAAGNPINPKFHLGKRDAYERFMGKDWPGRSLALGNLALRLKYMVTSTAEKEGDGTGSTTATPGSSSSGGSSSTTTNGLIDTEETQRSLLERVLRLRIRELQMEMAEIDSDLAVARNNYDGDSFVTTETTVADLENAKVDLQDNLRKAQEDMEVVLATGTTEAGTFSGPINSITSILDRIASWSTSQNDNAAPYRGAIGYAPMLDSRQEVDDTSLAMQQYSSPYDLLKEVLKDQLNAKVIGCALENTSLLRGNIALGGAIVLQRLTPTRTMKVAGEDVQYNDYDETFGNEGIKGGEVFVVDCDVDEAIGVSLAYNLPLNVDGSIWDTSPVLVEPVDAGTESKHIKDVLPIWKVVDTEMSLQKEGDVETVSRPSPISIPLTTSTLFDSIFEQKPSRSADSSMFPTDNPIKSLDQLDGLTNEDKAKTLLQMSNFNGKLPRPRVVRNAPPNENPLDKLLLPLIDESVRKQYAIREAKNQGDWNLVRDLTASKSKLQEAREKADAARDDGNNDLANQWDEEARLLESLRADVTQDVGAYSRFLDRDDWYERDRLKAAKRAKKSSFGNLLDGIE